MLDRNRMPAYKSHKTVWALKIASIEPIPEESHVHAASWRIVPTNNIHYPAIEVPHSYMLKHSPQPGGYFVEYEDGYQSFSPAKAFEEGYTRMVDVAPSSDAAIEQEIQAKGLTAPRVTPSDINGNIAHVEYVKHISKGGQVLRWAVITTQSGFAVVGDPSCSVSPENDDAEIGEKVAFSNSKQGLWPLMGYALKEQLYQAQQPAQAPV